MKKDKCRDVQYWISQINLSNVKIDTSEPSKNQELEIITGKSVSESKFEFGNEAVQEGKVNQEVQEEKNHVGPSTTEELAPKVVHNKSEGLGPQVDETNNEKRELKHGEGSPVDKKEEVGGLPETQSDREKEGEKPSNPVNEDHHHRADEHPQKLEEHKNEENHVVDENHEISEHEGEPTNEVKSSANQELMKVNLISNSENENQVTFTHNNESATQSI